MCCFQPDAHPCSALLSLPLHAPARRQPPSDQTAAAASTILPAPCRIWQHSFPTFPADRRPTRGTRSTGARRLRSLPSGQPDHSQPVTTLPEPKNIVARPQQRKPCSSGLRSPRSARLFDFDCRAIHLQIEELHAICVDVNVLPHVDDGITADSCGT